MHQHQLENPEWNIIKRVRFTQIKLWTLANHILNNWIGQNIRLLIVVKTKTWPTPSPCGLLNSFWEKKQPTNIQQNNKNLSYSDCLLILRDLFIPEEPKDIFFLNDKILILWNLNPIVSSSSKDTDWPTSTLRTIYIRPYNLVGEKATSDVARYLHLEFKSWF